MIAISFLLGLGVGMLIGNIVLVFYNYYKHNNWWPQNAIQAVIAWLVVCVALVAMGSV